jgi:hypothetical protein
VNYITKETTCYVNLYNWCIPVESLDPNGINRKWLFSPARLRVMNSVTEDGDIDSRIDFQFEAIHGTATWSP